MGGAPYNGYDWRQRARIIPAHVRATGRRDPFVGAPCSMCCDPNRAAAEWHSEDYSEPYSFEPPASYPVCKPCHGRLHKRFNAPAGEWQLFCRHLDAGGYGREFVQLHSVADRRALCARLVEGEAVALAFIRARRSGDDWWSDLTLDPEALEAPWARPRPLRPRPDAAAFAAAMAMLTLTDLEWAMLRFHAAAPRRTATMRDIAAHVLGKGDASLANLHYGRVARKLCETLGWKPDRRPDGSAIWMSLLAEGWHPPGREYEWTMVRSAADAAMIKAA